MAVGWTRDGAVQDQIDASVEDALQRAKRNLTEARVPDYAQSAGRLFQKPDARRFPECRFA